MYKPVFVLPILLLAAAITQSCAYNYTFETGLQPAEDVKVTEWKHIGLWGWVEPSPFDLTKACPEGVAQFGSYVSLPNWLCALVTVGLYAPRTAYAVPVRGYRPTRVESPPPAPGRRPRVAPTPAGEARVNRPRSHDDPELDELESLRSDLFE